MKWVFCINEQGSYNHNLFLLKYAVLSAKKYTSLQPVCLFFGNNKYLEYFLKKHNVEIIKAEEPEASKILRSLPTSSPFWNLNHQKIINFASGAFLRFEIHKYIEATHCLYTDIDVLFTENFRIPEKSKEAMSMAYQEIDVPSDYNSGVILFNLDKFKKEVYSEISYKVSNSYKEWAIRKFDQYVINSYFKDIVSNLDINLNWRPLFGWSDNAQILHYEIIKPFQNNYDKLRYKYERDAYDIYNKYYFEQMIKLEE